MELILLILLIFILVLWFKYGRKIDVDVSKAPYKLEPPEVNFSQEKAYKNKKMEIIPPSINFKTDTSKLAIQKDISTNSNEPATSLESQDVKKADSTKSATKTPRKRGRSKKT